MSPRLAFAVDAVHRAGRATLAHFHAGVATVYKGDGSPLTVADRQAETLLRESIRAAFPGEAILGEEEGAEGESGVRWVIDPIDGTKSFVSGVPLFATLLACEVEGEPRLGVCFFPALGEMLFAEAGGGAFLNGIPCRTTMQKPLEQAVVCSAGLSGLERSGRLEGMLAISRHVMAVRTWCDAYGHALVASGRAEAMVDPVVNRWDISAMAVIVREAGGAFTDFSGSQALAEEAVSAAPWIHPTILEAFRV